MASSGSIFFAGVGTTFLILGAGFGSGTPHGELGFEGTRWRFTAEHKKKCRRLFA